MNKFLITLSTLGVFDLYFLIVNAAENIEKNPEIAAKDFTPEGLLKIKSIHKQFKDELMTEVKLGKYSAKNN